MARLPPGLVAKLFGESGIGIVIVKVEKGGFVNNYCITFTQDIPTYWYAQDSCMTKAPLRVKKKKLKD